MSELPEYGKLLINGIARSAKFTEFTVQTLPGSNHGDNIMGVLVSVIISGTQISFNGQKIEGKLNLICKLAPESEERRREFQTARNFGREVLMYNKILPLFEQFQREKGLANDEAFLAYPKCYAAIADEKENQFIIIMEDLKQRHFSMWPRHMTTVADHAYLVMEKFAKLHAVSFALKDQRPEIYNELRHIPDFFHYYFESKGVSNLFDKCYDRAIDSLKQEEHRKILQEVKGNIQNYFKEYADTAYFEPFGVIDHGDCWNNNIMYQYKDGKLEDVCFIDWQESRFGSTAMDLHFNIFSSTDKNLRDNEYKNLIEHYYQTLSQAITKLGSDPIRLYTHDNLQNDLKKCGRFAFIWAPVIIQQILAEEEDIPDLDELCKDMANQKNDVDIIKGFNSETQIEFVKRINDILTDLVDYGYYWN